MSTNPERENATGVDRRRFLEGVAAGAGAVAAAWIGPVARGVPAARASGRNELPDLTAREAVAAMRAGDLTGDEVRRRPDRANEIAHHPNAIRSLDADQVLAAARAADKRRARGVRPGPLHGLPVLIKDNIDTAAAATTAGHPCAGRQPAAGQRAGGRPAAGSGRDRSRQEQPARARRRHHEQQRRLRAVRNPYDPARIPGGSSAGNGCAVAARMAAAALGTDTAGSVRIPAALCGIAALRPTVGRYPRTGDPDA